MSVGDRAFDQMHSHNSKKLPFYHTIQHYVEYITITNLFHVVLVSVTVSDSRGARGVGFYLLEFPSKLREINQQFSPRAAAQVYLINYKSFWFIKILSFSLFVLQFVSFIVVFLFLFLFGLFLYFFEINKQFSPRAAAQVIALT